MSSSRSLFVLLTSSLLLVYSCGSSQSDRTLESVSDSLAIRVDFGKQLFFDKALSRDNSLSCASCHLPELAFSDSLPKSKGFAGRTFLRNSPSLLNAKVHPYFFADGGAPSLETQAIQPIEDEHEMSMPLDQLAYRLRKDGIYNAIAKQAFGRELDEFCVTHALAEYVRSLESTGSKYDHYLKDRNEEIFTEIELAGMKVFFGKGKCGNCHSGPWLSDFKFYDIGTGSAQDLGRERITLRPEDRHKFKTPILRNLTLTAPYFHDGSIATLKGVVEHFNKLDKLQLNEKEQVELIGFLESLTDSIYTKQANFAKYE